MKKTYINPEMEVVEIHKPMLLAGSLEVFNTEVGSEDVLAPDLGAGDLITFDDDALDIEL